MVEEIYLDKIKLGAIIVEKELSMIDNFNKLIRDVRNRPEIKEFLNDYPLYYETWQIAISLYQFLEYDYLEKLKAEERTVLKEMIERYLEFKQMSINELEVIVSLIRKIMSLSKFHNIVRDKGEAEGWEGEKW